MNDGSSRDVSGSASPHKADVYSQAAVLAAALQAHEDAIGDGGPLRVLHLAVHAYLHVHEGVCTRAGGGWRRGVAAGAVAWELPRLPAIAWCLPIVRGTWEQRRARDGLTAAAGLASSPRCLLLALVHPSCPNGPGWAVCVLVGARSPPVLTLFCGSVCRLLRRRRDSGCAILLAAWLPRVTLWPVARTCGVLFGPFVTTNQSRSANKRLQGSAKPLFPKIVPQQVNQFCCGIARHLHSIAITLSTPRALLVAAFVLAIPCGTADKIVCCPPYNIRVCSWLLALPS